MVGCHGDPEVELTQKQYMMLEYICRRRSQGEWQSVLAKHMLQDAKNMFYHRKCLSMGGFVKRRVSLFQVLFLFSFFFFFFLW